MRKIWSLLWNKYYLFLQAFGCAGFIIATFLINKIAALYVASGIVLLYGVIIEITQGKE